MAEKEVIAKGKVRLTPRIPEKTGTIMQAMHLQPGLIPPVIWMCMVCIVSATFVALWKILIGNDASVFPYALATACVLGNFLVLAAYFGKSGKAGAISTAG